jgi:pimeloyl-ACP methyl ester carboxylesterase
VRPPVTAIRTEGDGADVVFIHGTGADKASWSALVALVRSRIRATTYDRRGTASWPIADDDPAPLVQDHAQDAADVIAGLGPQPVHVCAASFGAVVALELLKTRPELVTSAILFEPALSGDDRICSVPGELSREVARFVASGQAESAAEVFYRRALGAAWRTLPEVVRKDMAARGRQIDLDLRANAVYRVRYGTLGGVAAPVLLLQGGRSRTVFAPSLRALAAVLPQSQCIVISGAGHFPRGAAWREFAAAMTAFIGV